MFNQQRSRFTSWFFNRPRTSGIFVFLVLALVVVFMLVQRYEIIRQNDRREMSNLLEAVRGNITQCLQNSYITAMSGALTINDEGTPENFEEVAKVLLESNPRVDGMQLLPDGVVKYIYPYERHQSALGLNILAEPDLRADAIKSKNDRKFYFAGPLKLRQGGVGVIGRLPVYKQNKFWGFTAVVIEFNTLIRESGINSIDQSKYFFQFSRHNPFTGEEEFYLPQPTNFSNKQYESVSFPDSRWTLYIVNRTQDDAFWQLLPLAISGLMLAMLFGLIISLVLEQPAELQKIVIQQAKKLAGSELRYKTIFEQAAVGIVYVDSRDGKILDANKQFTTMLEYDREDIKNRRFQEFTHPDDIENNEELMADLLEGKVNSLQFEKRYYTKTGKLIWVNLTVVPIQTIDGMTDTHIAVVEDITVTKLAQEKIKESEVRFKSLFEDLPIALWEEDFSAVKEKVKHFDGSLSDERLTEMLEANPDFVLECVELVRVIDVNNECLRLHHPKTKEELLKGLCGIISRDSLEVFIQQLVAVIKGKTEIMAESALTNSDGKQRDVLLRWTAMQGYEDSLERVIVSTEDITFQKDTERVRAASQQKIENIVNTIDGIVWECDAVTHKLHFISRKVEEILGYTTDEWWSDENFWSNHIHPDDRAIAIRTFENIANEQIEAEFEYRMIAKHGDIVWIRDIVSVHHENNETILRGIMIDITAHKEADTDLHNSLQLVNEQKKRLMNFSYIVSHNLRSHNANIQSIINLVQSSDSDEERKELIGHLKTVSDSLNDTMRHLGDLVNIQSNIALVREPLRINHYIDATKNILSELIAARQVTIINNVPESAVVNYNPAYLESIILNLVSNGIRYSHPDRKPLIRLDWEDDGTWYILKVSDNGLGIDLKRYGDKLFGMYKTFHGNPEARGVGLFMTRSQIEAMGGQIKVDSEPGKGSTFCIYFKKS